MMKNCHPCESLKSMCYEAESFYLGQEINGKICDVCFYFCWMLAYVRWDVSLCSYFSFVFPVFYFGIDATQRKSARQLIRFPAVSRWWHFHVWLFIFLEKKIITTLINSTWSFGYHPQIFLVSNLQTMGCSWNVISPLCSCCFSCVVAHWALQVVAWIFVCTLSCISILSHFCSWMLFRNGATYHA